MAPARRGRWRRRSRRPRASRSYGSSAAPNSSRRRCRWPTSPKSPRSTPISKVTSSRRNSGRNGRNARAKNTLPRAESRTVSSPTRTPSEELDMSGAGFHVHGPHEHEMEHAIEHAGAHGEAGQANMVNQIAMVTAVIATVGAIFSYMGGATQANAGLLKNDAAIRKTEASNQWNYFQAKSTKQSLAEVSRDLAPPDKQAFYQAKIDRYEKEKNEIKTEAERIEAAAKEAD